VAADAFISAITHKITGAVLDFAKDRPMEQPDTLPASGASTGYAAIGICGGSLIKALCDDPVIHPITNQILDIDDGKTLRKLDQMLWIMGQLCVHADRLKAITEKCRPRPCKRCDGAGRELHVCPFEQEINNDETPCNCCAKCTDDCSMEI
jgi:hypothetical protein